MPSRISPALRERVAAAARYRCGYCLTSQRVVGPLLEIDHIIPESRGGASAEDNLWLACPPCNGHKSDQVEAVDPETGQTVPLFNPRTQRWQDHFTWMEDGAVILGITATGRATVSALQVNPPSRPSCRAEIVGHSRLASTSRLNSVYAGCARKFCRIYAYPTMNRRADRAPVACFSGLGSLSLAIHHLARPRSCAFAYRCCKTLTDTRLRRFAALSLRAIITLL